MSQTRNFRYLLFEIFECLCVFYRPLLFSIIFSVVVSDYLFALIRIYLDRYWIAPRKKLSSFALLSRFTFFIAINLSCSGLIPFWLILWPIHSVSVLENSELFSLSLFPAFSSRVETSISSFLFVLLSLWLQLLCRLATLGVCFLESGQFFS